MDKVHVDEKWFWLCKDGEKYILVDDEPCFQARHTKHKNYIEKVMFLCAQARPRKDYMTANQANVGWQAWNLAYWTLGIGPKKLVPTALQELQSGRMTAWTRSGTQEMMLDNVIPAILEKWPARW